jgi:hypothetical protein
VTFTMLPTRRSSSKLLHMFIMKQLLIFFSSSAGAKLEKFVMKRCKELNLPFQLSDMTSN